MIGPATLYYQTPSHMIESKNKECTDSQMVIVMIIMVVFARQDSHNQVISADLSLE